jgi:hypothetical protein
MDGWTQRDGCGVRLVKGGARTEALIGMSRTEKTTLTSDQEMTSMASSDDVSDTAILLQERRYYSYFDEKYFYAWLESLDDVVAVRGTTKGLCVDLRDKHLSKLGAYELIALFTRYGYPLSPIASHINPDDHDYFHDPSARWFNALYGSVTEDDV